MRRSSDDSIYHLMHIFMGRLLKNTKCKHIYTSVNTLAHTITHPTVTVLPSLLHRQLGPARFLSEAMERAEEEEGATGRLSQTRSRTEEIKESEEAA